jgi:hypothetical protein
VVGGFVPSGVAAGCCLWGHAVPDGAPELMAQLRRVLVPVHRHRMLCGRIQQFGLGIGDDGDRAVHLAREGTAASMVTATPPAGTVILRPGRRAPTRSPTRAYGPNVAGHAPGLVAMLRQSRFPKGDIRGAPMIQVRHQPEFLAHAEALECWARARERAITVLECEAEHALRQGLVDQALRLRSAASHLRQAALEERRRAAQLREATAAHAHPA